MSIRLFIHAGTHKTATTAFQGVCFENRELLATWGVIYPFARQHSELAHQLQRGELNNLRCLLDLIRTKFDDDTTLLLSGEDFENVLVNDEMAITLENEVAKKGFAPVEWYFVFRNQVDYFHSIYAQLCKQGVVLDRRKILSEIVDKGHFSVSHWDFDYNFAFDYDRYVEDFATTRPDRVYAERFDSFRSPFVGAPLFQRLGIGEAQLAHLQARAVAVGAPNQRADPVEVEAKYCFNELGIKNDADMEAKRIAFQRLLATRLKNLRKDMARAETELAAKFKDTAFF